MWMTVLEAQPCVRACARVLTRPFRHVCVCMCVCVCVCMCVCVCVIDEWQAAAGRVLELVAGWVIQPVDVGRN